MNLLPRAQEKLYFQNAAGKVYYHPTGYVRLAWAAERLSLEAIQAFYEQVLSLLLSTGSHKILSYHGQRALVGGGSAVADGRLDFARH